MLIGEGRLGIFSCCGNLTDTTDNQPQLKSPTPVLRTVIAIVGQWPELPLRRSMVDNFPRIPPHAD